MGRAARGWQLRAPGGKRTTYSVRFSHGGRQVERSTGERSRRRAAAAAARIYAAAMHQEPARARLRSRGTAHLRELADQWLAETQLADTTRNTWQVYARRFIKHFSSIDGLTSAEAARYVKRRLQEVQAATVRKECSALRSLLSWLQLRGVVTWLATVPSVPRRARGNRQHAAGKRTAAVELSPAEVADIIAALPEWSSSRRVARFPVRARFRVQYESGLRPSTIDRLEVPRHYRKGATHLRLDDAADKTRWARSVPLSRQARAALDSVCPTEGLIFGAHDYREATWPAAAAVLDPARAKLFTAAHLRSARATHWLEAPNASIPGVMYLLGHKLLATTSRYLRASERAAAAVVRAPRRRPK